MIIIKIITFYFLSLVSKFTKHSRLITVVLLTLMRVSVIVCAEARHYRRDRESNPSLPPSLFLSSARSVSRALCDQPQRCCGYFV